MVNLLLLHMENWVSSVHLTQFELLGLHRSHLLLQLVLVRCQISLSLLPKKKTKHPEIGILKLKTDSYPYTLTSFKASDFSFGNLRRLVLLITEADRPGSPVKIPPSLLYVGCTEP